MGLPIIPAVEIAGIHPVVHISLIGNQVNKPFVAVQQIAAF